MVASYGAALWSGSSVGLIQVADADSTISGTRVRFFGFRVLWIRELRRHAWGIGLRVRPRCTYIILARLQTTLAWICFINLGGPHWEEGAQ